MVWGAIASAVVGAVANKVMNDDEPSDISSDDSSSAGVQSAVNGQTPPQSVNVVTSGSQSNKLVSDLMQSGVTAGIQSVLGKKPPSASQLGADNRAYLDASFPELNAWEKAGASAVNMGTQLGEQANAREMQKNQLQSQERIANKQLQTQERIAAMQIEPAYQKLELEKRLLGAQASLVSQQEAHEFERTVNSIMEGYNIEANNDQIKARTEQILAETEKTVMAKGFIGTTVEDIKAQMKTVVPADKLDGFARKMFRALGDFFSGAEAKLRPPKSDGVGSAIGEGYRNKAQKSYMESLGIPSSDIVK